MKSEATTVKEYLGELPEERRAAIKVVRKVVLDNLPEGYEEAMNWGMITYLVPLDVYPDTYNKQPLMYASLGSQKNYMTLYLMGIYGTEERSEEFEAAYRETGKRYDVGKSCVRFRKLDDLPLELIGETIAGIEIDDFVEAAKTVKSGWKKGK